MQKKIKQCVITTASLFFIGGLSIMQSSCNKIDKEEKRQEEIQKEKNRTLESSCNELLTGTPISVHALTYHYHPQRHSIDLYIMIDARDKIIDHKDAPKAHKYILARATQTCSESDSSEDKCDNSGFPSLDGAPALIEAAIQENRSIVLQGCYDETKTFRIKSLEVMGFEVKK